MSRTKCQINPAKVTPVTFDIKFVNVENERVFAEISVPGVFCNSVDCIYKTPLQFRNRNKRNLVSCPMRSPDFWEINKQQNHIFSEYKRNRLKHRKPRVLRSESDAGIIIKKKIFPSPLPNFVMRQDMSALVDALLLDIYGPLGDKCRSESDSTFSSTPYPRNSHVQRFRLLMKSVKELHVAQLNLWNRINHVGSMLVRQLRRRDNLIAKRDKFYDVITAHLQALSNKRSEDTRMRFSLIPQPGESGFPQWLDAMKMVTKLQGGIPPEFRKRLWLTLAERHLAERGVDWSQAEKICFNEWSNPDDDELGIQIVKDLHRTGCSLFCGAAGRDNQAVLRRVLLGFARWNKSVGYCQGLNVLAALILQVVDRAESAAVKVMIYLVEGVLPEAYFADNLRGLSIDMAVFRDLLRVRLPKLSRHLEALQVDSRDKNVVGNNYEPPLTNVFTMQWFLTLFCHCLPQEAVLRVWDLIFLEGDEVLLRTALAIWEGLADRIMPVKSADEFYSIMGVLTREMLEFTDTNYLIKRIVNMGPLYGVTSLREKHRYNITPWARRLSDDDETDTEDEDRLAVETATVMMNISRKKDRSSSPLGALLPSSDRERLALDISSLKQQYAKLRERQRQAHIILSAACARQTMVPAPSSPAINHLLVGKTALVSGKTRQIGPPSRLAKKSSASAAKAPSREDKQGVTLHWKDMKKSKDNASAADAKSPEEPAKSTDSDSDSTSTELCDEPDRLSDLDSGDPSSTSDRWSPQTSPIDFPDDSNKTSEIHDITERIDRLSLQKSVDDLEDNTAEETNIEDQSGKAEEIKTETEDTDKLVVSHENEEKETEKRLELSPEKESEFAFEKMLEEKSLESKLQSNRSSKLETDYSSSDDYQNEKPLEASNDFVLKYQYKFDTFESKYSYEEFEYKPRYDDRTSNLISEESFYNKFEDKAEDTVQSTTVFESPKFDRKESPKSPESAKSYSSGETLGPDSKISTVTDLTPVDPERPFSRKKSVGSTDSESKTLTIRSAESVSEDQKMKKKQEPLKTNSIEIASPWTSMSADSLQNKSDLSPKLVVSASSSESYSPGKLKFSERSFSSDLQSPVSANSINYQSNYKMKEGNPSESPSIETIAITSPFYPIAHPNQKTPSPYSPKKPETSPKSRLEPFDTESKTSLNYSLDYDYKPYKYTSNSDYKKPDDFLYQTSLTKIESPKKDVMTDSYTEDGMDTLSPLPREGKFEFLHRGRDDRKLLGIGPRTFERSSSSLDKTLGDLKTSPSSDEFVTKSVKKRSSDILEDIRHLEAKSSTDSSNLTKTTGYIWEDVKDLEARRQDTFSDSAKSFSRDTLSRPTISVSSEMRKTYVVEPKINIDDGSILKSITTKEGDEDDDSNLGVWTKVKPRKKGENGRRSSDRALKIIQENSAILQKILTCQAKKRLPDLEAISKEITISPINEEISKIFSPILEKMGLNEHEINEELARINFQELDHKFDVQSTCTSGFSAKINDELSKLSIIDDNEEINHLALDEFIAEDYLNTREAVIDRQINEELSKLLATEDRNKEKMQYFSYKSVDSDTSTLSELEYQDQVPRYRGVSPKSDVDIYHELERLDLSTNVPSTSTIDAYKYSPVLDKPSSPYCYKLYNYSSKLSPDLDSSIIPSQKSPLESYDYGSKRSEVDYGSYLSKENLEFRVRYDQESTNLDFPESKYYKDNYSYESFNYSSKFDVSPLRYSYGTDYGEGSDVVSNLPGDFDCYSRASRRPVSHPEFAGSLSSAKYPEEVGRDSSAVRTSSLSLDDIGKKPVTNVDTTPSPKSHFSPFPRNSARKPKDLALKLGLYSPTSPTHEPLKRS